MFKYIIIIFFDYIYSSIISFECPCKNSKGYPGPLLKSSRAGSAQEVLPELLLRTTTQEVKT